MDVKEVRENPESRMAGGILGVWILIVAGVSFFRRKRTLDVTNPVTSEEWEDCPGI